jgi:hypothetical protein
VKPRRKARIYESRRSPGINQEPERPFAADTDVGDDRRPSDDSYRHNRRKSGLRRTGVLEHGQLQAWDQGRRGSVRLAAATPGDEGDDGDDNDRTSSRQSSTHRVRSRGLVPTATG